MYRKTFWLLLSATVALFIVILLHPERQTAVSGTGMPFFPLFDKTAITAVGIEKDGQTLTFLKDKTGRWSLMEENGAYVRDGYVDDFIDVLATLKKDVPATRLDAFYAEEQVDEASACLVSFMNDAGDTQAVLLVGKAFSDVRGKGFFVRLPDEEQSWRTFSKTPLCLQVPVLNEGV